MALPGSLQSHFWLWADQLTSATFSLISLCGMFAHPAFQAQRNDELPCVLCFYIQAFASTISSAWNVLCRLPLVNPYASLRSRWKNSGPSLPKQPVTQSSELPKHLAHAPVTAQSHRMTMAVSKIAFQYTSELCQDRFSLMHAFIQQIFIKYLLCGRHCSRHWDDSS